MKVRELIKDTVWTPGRDYAGARPVVSVLLPTFRRGADGLFMKAATSVLAQTLQELELIIVDDASTDGTAEQIAALMAADPRVSCLTHPSNIGLPAVSEYEAFLRSRGEYIAFAFDDFIFEPAALDALLTESREHANTVTHGYVEVLDRQGGLFHLGKAPQSHELLNYYNFIGNSSFLVARPILDDVGLFDPHIAAARVCDWDLWRRIFRKYHIRRADILVGTEYGVARDDSLGNSYPISMDCMQEYFGTPRNLHLRPDAFADFDVWRMPSDATASLAAHVIAVRRFLKPKTWAVSEPLSSAEDVSLLFSPKRPIVGIFGPVEASTSLVFDGLLATCAQNFLFLAPEADPLALPLSVARCDAVIIVRNLLHPSTSGLIRACTAMGVPLYFYTDDNFMVLANSDPDYADYRSSAVAECLSRFDGIFLTSPLLAEYFEFFDLGTSIKLLGPTYDFEMREKLGRLEAAPRGSELRVGFTGGDFRAKHLIDAVMPALVNVHRHTPIHLVVRSTVGGLDDVPFSMTKMELCSFDEFLVRWRELQLDILIHPKGDHANVDYKTANSLLVAHYLGAVPIICDETAYQDVDEKDGVLKIDGSICAWEQAIQRAADAQFRRQLGAKLEVYCREKFSPRHNLAVVEEFFAELGRADVCAWNERISRLVSPSSDHGFSARLALMEAEVRSRAYRFALRLRKASKMVRGVGTWMHTAMTRLRTAP